MLRCSFLPSRARSSCSEPMPISLPADEISAVPPQFGCAGIGEDRFVEHVFPIAGEFLLGGDAPGKRARAAAGAADDDAFADFDALSRSQLSSTGRSILPSACTRPKPVSWSKPSAMTLHDAPVAEMQPDGFGFGDQIADGENEPIVDQHAIAGALDTERVGGKGVGRDDRVQADHRRQRALEIVGIVLCARLHRLRHLPFDQRGHRYAPRVCVLSYAGSCGRKDGAHMLV